MRTILIAALLAGVAAPALAARPVEDSDGNRRERSERSERSEGSETRVSVPRKDRSETHESAPRQERSVDRPEPRSIERRSETLGSEHSDEARSRDLDAGTARIERVERRAGGDHDRDGRQREQAAGARSDDGRQAVVKAREVRPPRNESEEASGERPSSETVRNWRARERRTGESGSSIEERNLRHAPKGGSGIVETTRSMPGVFNRTERRISRTPVRGTEPPAPRTATAIGAKPARHWRTDWRHDGRHDWRDWRRRHRSRFHLGFYYDPFGWDYFRYGVGWRLWPNYYRRSFWLNDPWQFRLPPAYGPYRWVRYFKDALLVNIYTGEVVDVEYNFFW